MLRLLSIDLEFPADAPHHSSMGSLLQGVLMELIPEEAARELHAEGTRPYSQALVLPRGEAAGHAVWRLGFLNDRAFHLLGAPLVERDGIYIRHRDLPVALRGVREIKKATFEGLADASFQAERAADGAEFSFLTPTAFKRRGDYVSLPEAFLIFQSLVSRWNAFTDFSRLEEPNLAEKLAQACRPGRYRIASRGFSLEGTTIYGCGGQMKFFFRGPEQVRRLLAMLASFALFAGIGVKTAMGMGATDAAIFFRR